VSRWYPAVDSHWSASKASKMGVFGALGFAAWIGIPTALLVTFHGQQIASGLVSPLEIAVSALLVGLALVTAWRFRQHKGLVVGPILLVALVIEVTKRLILTANGTLSFGVFDAVLTFMMFFGLLNGIRGVRALRHLTPDGDLEVIFE
jgi:hypothetical protein